MRFALSHAGAIEVAIHDIAARAVGRMRTKAAAGEQTLSWDGLDDAGRRASPGIYIVRARVGGIQLAGRVLRLR